MDFAFILVNYFYTLNTKFSFNYFFLKDYSFLVIINVNQAEVALTTGVKIRKRAKISKDEKIQEPSEIIRNIIARFLCIRLAKWDTE